MSFELPAASGYYLLVLANGAEVAAFYEPNGQRWTAAEGNVLIGGGSFVDLGSERYEIVSAARFR